MRTSLAAPLALAAGLWLALAAGAQAQQLAQAVQQEQQINQAGAQSQRRIDQISDQTQALLEEYRSINARIDTLRVYNRQLQALVTSQENEMASFARQIEDVTTIEREIMPLMEEMIASLGQFVELDVPFLLRERRERVAKLKELMERSDVSVSEKYRRLMEAYQIENDYGHAVDTYRDTLETAGDTKTVVDFLKIGRVAFLYLTLDDSEAGVWDQKNQRWERANGYRSAIRKGLKMANKQEAFDLLTLPVSAPQPAAQARSATQEMGE